jgi:microcystin-dependent protein
LSGATGTPFSNLQPALAVTQVILSTGLYPGSATEGDTIGFIYNFAGDYAPGNSLLLDGQVLSIAANTALYSVIGSNYGGNGSTTFALPDLQGVSTIGAGTAAGLTTASLGVTSGTATVALTAAQVPAPLPGAGGQSFDNMAPSLAVTPIIQVSGTFPSEDSGSGSSTFIGQIADFAGPLIPGGWMAANGALLSIASYPDLFSLIGTTYGGNGTTTFALPNLTGRVAVGAGPSDVLGTQFGQDSTTVTEAELPTGQVTGGTATDQPVTNDQPSLVVNYLISLSGLFPTSDGTAFDATTPTLGQIVASAGDLVPVGWALCDGQLISIQSNEALFAILGTKYGGNGTTTFALPNLEGRTLIGAGTSAAGTTYTVGEVVGSNQTNLTVANLPTADQPPVPCFLPGTLILTPSGERAVEALAPGDPVCTFGGAIRPIVWIGTGRTLSISGRRDAATPVIVRKGAFAPNVPHADLHVTKGHSFYLDGVLIPAEFLVNHQSILWDDRSQEVTVYHVELETHDLLVANGAAAETYRDDGNRHLFRNANPGWTLPPKPACAPVMTGGAVVDAVWRRLLHRAGPLPPLSLTDDPDLHLLVDGRTVAASARHADWWVFPLPAAAKELRLVSRAAVPQELGTARDPRRLGVAVRRILVRKGTRCRSVEAADPALATGFHAFEADIGIRWTNGDAVVPAGLLAGLERGGELLVCLAGGTVYATDTAGRRAA